MLAADLGLHPRDLASMSTRSLFDLREKSAFDELTGVLRRAAGVAAAEREMARARRHSTPLTVAFIDVDGLKEANDARGHARQRDELSSHNGDAAPLLSRDDEDAGNSASTSYKRLSFTFHEDVCVLS